MCERISRNDAKCLNVKTVTNLLSSCTLVFKYAAEFTVLYCYSRGFSDERRRTRFCSPQPVLCGKKSNLNKFEGVSTTNLQSAPLHPRAPYSSLIGSLHLLLVATHDTSQHTSMVLHELHVNCCSSYKKLAPFMNKYVNFN